MHGARIVLLSMVATLLAVAAWASPASAKISFEWSVGGKLLAAGQSREFTTNTDGKEGTMTGTVGATKTELLGSSLGLEKGAKIIGGKPGTGEGVGLLTGVKVVKPLFEGKETCGVNSPGQSVGTIKTNTLKGEIVENQENGEPLILFTPKTGTIFGEIEFTETAKECVLKGSKVSITGSALALPLPGLGEVLTGELTLEAKSKEFLLSPGGGTVEKSGLSLGGKTATITGLSLVLLVSHELAGII